MAYRHSEDEPSAPPPQAGAGPSHQLARAAPHPSQGTASRFAERTHLPRISPLPPTPGNQTCYGTILDQLRDLGRQICHVPEGPESAFESILKQLNSSSVITIAELKMNASLVGRNAPYRYMKRGIDTEKLFVREIWKMERFPAPNLQLLYQFLAMIHDVVQRKIVIIRHRKKPIILNEDKLHISQQDIVIVECEPMTMYHATSVVNGKISH